MIKSFYKTMKINLFELKDNTGLQGRPLLTPQWCCYVYYGKTDSIRWIILKSHNLSGWKCDISFCIDVYFRTGLNNITFLSSIYAITLYAIYAICEGQMKEMTFFMINRHDFFQTCNASNPHYLETGTCLSHIESTTPDTV